MNLEKLNIVKKNVEELLVFVSLVNFYHNFPDLVLRDMFIDNLHIYKIN